MSRISALLEEVVCSRMIVGQPRIVIFTYGSILCSLEKGETRVSHRRLKLLLLHHVHRVINLVRRLLAVACVKQGEGRLSTHRLVELRVAKIALAPSRTLQPPRDVLLPLNEPHVLFVRLLGLLLLVLVLHLLHKQNFVVWFIFKYLSNALATDG